MIRDLELNYINSPNTESFQRTTILEQSSFMTQLYKVNIDA